MSISTSDSSTFSAKATFSETSISETYTSSAGSTTGASSANGANASDKSKLTPATAQQQLNLSIVQTSLQVSLSAKNDRLALVYKSAIENINYILKATQGDNALENASAQDNSPEATAGRILAFVKSTFGLFQQNAAKNNGDSNTNTKASSSDSTTPATNDNANLDKFFEQIKSGIEKGFEEARGILEGLKVLNGDIASNIDKTYALVQKGLSDFIDSIKNPKPDNGDGSNTSVVSESISLSISVSTSTSSTTVSG